MVVPCSGEYNPVLSTRQQFEQLKLNFVDVLLEQTQGGHALASNSYSYGAILSIRCGWARVGRLMLGDACVAPTGCGATTASGADTACVARSIRIWLRWFW